MALDKLTTLNRRNMAKAKYSTQPLDLKRLENDLRNDRRFTDNSRAYRFDMVRGEGPQERII